MGEPAPKQWLYLDSLGQKGPFSEPSLLKLVRRGIVGPATLLWSDGMPEWQAASAVSEFADVSLAVSSRWTYLTDTNAQQGPLTADALIKLCMDGEVDGMTKVWTDQMTEWKPLSEVAGLKRILQLEQEAEEQADAMPAQPELAQQSYDESMVFQEDSQPTLESAGLGKTAGKKSYVTDDGLRLVWDEATKEWVEGGEEDEDDAEDEQEEEEEPMWKVKRKEKKEAAAKAKKEEKLQKRLAKKAAKEAEGEATQQEKDNHEEGKGDLAELGVSETIPAEANGDAGSSTSERSREGSKKKKKKKKSKFGAKDTRWVYVQGFPPDVTEEEVKEHFSKVGVLALDPATQAPRIKLYKDPETNELKGDGSVCYAMGESVPLALEVLDGSQIRAGSFLKVTRAVFQQKGEFEERKRLKVTDARVKVAKAAQQMAISWNEEDDSGATGSSLKIVVIENMFTPKDFEDDPNFGVELEQDLREECEKLGPVQKITLFSRNPLGPAVVKFATAFGAQETIKKMDGRWFGQHKLRCHYWDGTTDYTVKESDSAQQQRLEEFGDWLESQELPDELKLRTE